MEGKFILCYHDFSVRNFRDAQRHVRQISDVAARPITVAVIPAVEGFSESEIVKFRNALSELLESGCELLLHGARHFAQTSNRSLSGRLALRLTGNEAEFAGLDEWDSFALLETACREWERLGFEPLSGFVPPAWYGNPFLLKQAHSRFEFFEGRCAIKKRSSGRVISPALSFAGLPEVSLGGVRAFSKLVLRVPLAAPRLVFHPVDFETLGEHKISELVRFASLHRKQIFYREL